MKFVVNHPYHNEVEVKLHWETKSKIKKVLVYGVIIAATSAVVLKVFENREEARSV